MKKLGLFGLVLAAATAFTACEEVGIELDVPFTQVVEKTIEIPATQDTVVILSVDSIDSKIDSELEENIDKLKDLVVEKAELEIKSVNPNENLDQLLGKVKVTLHTGSVNGPKIFESDMYSNFTSLEEILLENPKSFTDFPINDVQQGVEILKNAGKIYGKMEYVGVNKTNSAYTIDIKAKVKFKAKVKSN